MERFTVGQKKERMMRNLIYTVVGGKEQYADVFYYFADSIERVIDASTTDFLVITDEKFKKNIEKRFGKKFNNLKFMIVSEETDVMQISIRKSFVFDYDFIFEYDKVLYLDSDIIVTRPIDTIFNLISEKEKLTVYHEADEYSHHNWNYYGFENYTDEEIKQFEIDNVMPFSCGHFGFFANQEMKIHFENIRNMIKNHIGKFFYEQCFFNYYFNTRRLTCPKLTGFHIASHVKTLSYDKFSSILFHFAGTNFSIEEKIQQMNSFYNKYITPATCLKKIETRNNIHKVINFENRPVIAEIGILEGEFSNYIYENFKPKELVLVDNVESNSLVTSGDKDGNNLKTFSGKYLIESVDNKFKDKKDVRVFRGDSYSMMNQFKDNYFDLIYIDADHSYKSAKKDLEISYEKIKNMGWILGHDYEVDPTKTTNIYDFQVMTSVTEFCKKYGQRIIFLAEDGCVTFAIQVNKYKKEEFENISNSFLNYDNIENKEEKENKRFEIINMYFDFLMAKK